jgi:hypothetical protein
MILSANCRIIRSISAVSTPLIEPKWWMTLAWTTPAALATSASFSACGPCSTSNASAAARMFSRAASGVRRTRVFETGRFY